MFPKGKCQRFTDRFTMHTLMVCKRVSQGGKHKNFVYICLLCFTVWCRTDRSCFKLCHCTCTTFFLVKKTYSFCLCSHIILQHVLDEVVSGYNKQHKSFVNILVIITTVKWYFVEFCVALLPISNLCTIFFDCSCDYYCLYLTSDPVIMEP